MAKFENIDNTNVAEDVKEQELSLTGGGVAELYKSLFGRPSDGFLQIIIIFPYDLAIIVLGIYSKDLKM